MATDSKKKSSKKLPSAQVTFANLQRRHKREIRNIFAAAGFDRIEHAADKEFSFKGATSDFDDIFVLENVIILAEYTATKESALSSHLKPKYIMYEKICNNSSEFLDFARSAPLNISGKLSSIYKNHQCKLFILYCSVNNVSSELKALIPHAKFLDYSIVRYFKLLTRTVKRSAQNEILAFLGVEYNSFADRALMNGPSAREPFHGSVLPETHSNFPLGFKVVSFYINPAALMARSYVLRRDGWRDRSGVYQRMIIRGKIDSIRKYLVEHRRVFVNNIIVTLPSGTKIFNSDENTIDPSIIQNTQPAIISIPYDFNSVGLIDGQHRVFSYYEGGSNEGAIASLRKQQNLLVTGIIYPIGVSDEEKTRFEASLFLEINSNQANAKSELKQAINQIIRPFNADSIARAVLDVLNDGTGALGGKFTQHYFETTALKTTSVVSYGLRPLVRPVAGGALFSKWSDPKKGAFIAEEDDEARNRYISYCANQVAIFIAAAKSRLPTHRWTTDRKVEDRLITPTVINGLIGALRQAVEAGVVVEFDSLHASFADLDKFKFHEYRSSQYTVMSSHIFAKYLSQNTADTAS